MLDKSKIIWLYGRPCSGKTAIGHELINRLHDMGIPHFFLDGDELRHTVNNDLGFSAAHRFENIRRAAELACLIAKQKQATVVCAFITPLNDLRGLVKSVTEKHALPLHAYFINTSAEDCMRRDVKGHYKLAKEGRLTSFTGISSSFEEPEPVAPTLSTLEMSAIECANKILQETMN